VQREANQLLKEFVLQYEQHGHSQEIYSMLEAHADCCLHTQPWQIYAMSDCCFVT